MPAIKMQNGGTALWTEGPGDLKGSTECLPGVEVCQHSMSSYGQVCSVRNSDKGEAGEGEMHRSCGNDSTVPGMWTENTARTCSSAQERIMSPFSFQ